MKKIRQICINAKFVIMYADIHIIYGIMLDQFMRESNVQFVTNIFRQNNLWHNILQIGILKNLIVKILRLQVTKFKKYKSFYPKAW